jgi:hypothetical protein
MIDSLLVGGDEILAAAERAGLSRSSKQRVKAILGDAFEGFQQFAQGLETRQAVAAQVPEQSAMYLDSLTILVDAEMHKLETARKVRQQIRELLPPARRANLDEELAKMTKN